MPAGTPRGFNLSGLPFGFPHGVPNGMNNPASLPGFFAAHSGGGGPNWPGPNAGDDDRHQTGPIRRMNRPHGMNRPPGPYDRQPKDARNMRWNGSGRLTPPRGGPGRPGGPRFADGGAATVGPREAVQGRSLKSYEDLDAVGASGNGELNY